MKQTVEYPPCCSGYSAGATDGVVLYTQQDGFGSGLASGAEQIVSQFGSE